MRTMLRVFFKFLWNSFTVALNTTDLYLRIWEVTWNCRRFVFLTCLRLFFQRLSLFDLYSCSYTGIDLFSLLKNFYPRIWHHLILVYDRNQKLNQFFFLRNRFILPIYISQILNIDPIVSIDRIYIKPLSIKLKKRTEN